MMNKLVIALSLLFTIGSFQKSYGQEHKIKLEKLFISQFGLNSDIFTFIPVSKLVSDTIRSKTMSVRINKYPDLINKEASSYGFLHFEGLQNGVLNNEVAILIEQQSAESAKLFVDSNGNLDFSDDGLSVELTSKGITIELFNSIQKKSSHHYLLQRTTINPENAASIESRYASQYPKNELLPAKNWLRFQRLSMQFSHGQLGGRPVTVLINDRDTNGLLDFDPSDRGDRLAIIEGHLNPKDNMNEFLNSGEPLDHNAIFRINGQNYRFKVVSQGQLVLSETNKSTRILYRQGVDISNYSIDFISGENRNIKDLIDDGKYLLVDIGGTWCGGCISQEPIIKKLFDQKKLNVIGIFGNDTKERVERYVKTHEINWPVAILTDQFKELFGVNLYPTYVLITPDGKIDFMENDATRISDFFKE